MSSFSGRILWIAAILVAFGGSGHAQSKPYPNPQVASASGDVAPDFTLTDQNGKKFRLSDQRGHWVLLFFYTGYWWPYCMTELREFARRSNDFEKLGVRLVPLSVDDRQHARVVWEKVAEKKFTILSDSGAVVAKKYGLLHRVEDRDTHLSEAPGNIALRTTLLIGSDGRERWRRVSQSVPDIPTAEETLAKVEEARERK